MTQPSLFGAAPSVRALLTGACLPYGGSAHHDLYNALAQDWPALVTGDEAALEASVGGSVQMAAVLLQAWSDAAAAMAAKGDRRAARLFYRQMSDLRVSLGKMLDERPGAEIYLDAGFGIEDPLDALRQRLAVLLAMLGDATALRLVHAMLWEYARLSRPAEAGSVELFHAAVGAEMLQGDYHARPHPETDLSDFLTEWREHGRNVLTSVLGAAPQSASAARPTPTPLRRLAQARAEAAPPPGSAVLFPSSILAGAGRSENEKELKRVLKDVLDKPLGGVRVPDDWDAWERALVAWHPNGGAFIRAVRDSQGSRPFWGHAVVCADGPPGTGKSMMCRSIAEYSGLPFKRYQCDNASDNTYGGTPIRWTSAQADFVTGALAWFRRRTFAACLDEIEKASGSRASSGGHMHDVLHGQWGRETAARWHSAFLNHEIDLTGVVFLCTSNDVSSLPQSLRDRMVVARVEEPTAEHLAALAPHVARDVCRDMGLEPGWGALDGEEWEALRAAWGAGGSIRRLQQLVTQIIRARDADPSLQRH
ncbi:hypothetical protein MEX01_24950 [Methylorubrum extorquens]|uniref:AAA family ATPase n=1 Tax=Methylorubrum extorquens TaxID=408 RepID=UPI00117413F5|nr:ATP-binding protein [Methylorubrum extorquens]GEL41904.1 hypothetical protein MEX01_24950 [Methylorubrum extorquens]